MRLRHKIPRNSRLDDPDFIWIDGQSQSDRLAVAKIDSGEPLEDQPSDDEECEVISITSIGSAEVTDLSSSPSPPPTAADVQEISTAIKSYSFPKSALESTSMSQNSFGPPAKRNFTAGIAAAMGANSYQGQSHNKKMKKSISCSDCGQVFHQAEPFLEHRRSCQGGPAVFKQCKMCDFLTEDNSELLSHVKEVHVGSNRKPSHMPNLLTHRGYPQKPEPKTAPPGPVPLVKKPLRPVNKGGGSGKHNRSTNKIDIRCNFCPEHSRPTFTDPSACQTHFVDCHKVHQCSTCGVGIHGAVAFFKHAASCKIKTPSPPQKPPVKIRRPSAEDVREAAEALALMASAAPPPPINQNTPIQSELLTSPALPGSILGGDSQPSQSSPSTTAKDPSLSIYPLKKEPKSANSNYTSSFVKSLADHVDAAIADDAKSIGDNESPSLPDPVSFRTQSPDENSLQPQVNESAASGETLSKAVPHVSFKNQTAKAPMKPLVSKTPKKYLRCEGCAFVTKQSARMNQHLENYHVRSPCPLCPNAAFNGKIPLGAHLKEAHGVNASITPASGSGRDTSPSTSPTSVTATASSGVSQRLASRTKPSQNLKLQCNYCPVICPSHSLLNEHLAFTHKKCLVGERGIGDKQVLKQSPTSSPPALEIRPKSSGNAKRDGTFKEPLPPKKYHRESPPPSEVSTPSSAVTGAAAKKSPTDAGPTEISSKTVVQPIPKPPCDDALKKYYEETTQDDNEIFNRKVDPGVFDQVMQQAFQRAMNLTTDGATTAVQVANQFQENCIPMAVNGFLAVWER